MSEYSEQISRVGWTRYVAQGQPLEMDPFCPQAVCCLAVRGYLDTWMPLVEQQGSLNGGHTQAREKGQEWCVQFRATWKPPSRFIMVFLSWFSNLQRMYLLKVLNASISECPAGLSAACNLLFSLPCWWLLFYSQLKIVLWFEAMIHFPHLLYLLLTWNYNLN